VSQFASAIVMWPFSMEEYTPEDLAGENAAIFNFKILCYYVIPRFSVLVLTYVRVRMMLQLAATALRERQAAETFRALYEAARLETPEPSVASSLHMPHRAGMEGAYNMV